MLRWFERILGWGSLGGLAKKLGFRREEEDRWIGEDAEDKSRPCVSAAPQSRLATSLTDNLQHCIAHSAHGRREGGRIRPTHREWEMVLTWSRSRIPTCLDRCLYPQSGSPCS